MPKIDISVVGVKLSVFGSIGIDNGSVGVFGSIGIDNGSVGVFGSFVFGFDSCDLSIQESDESFVIANAVTSAYTVAYFITPNAEVLCHAFQAGVRSHQRQQ